MQKPHIFRKHGGWICTVGSGGCFGATPCAAWHNWRSADPGLFLVAAAPVGSRDVWNRVLRDALRSHA